MVMPSSLAARLIPASEADADTDAAADADADADAVAGADGSSGVVCVATLVSFRVSVMS